MSWIDRFIRTSANTTMNIPDQVDLKLCLGLGTPLLSLDRIKITDKTRGSAQASNFQFSLY